MRITLGNIDGKALGYTLTRIGKAEPESDSGTINKVGMIGTMNEVGMIGHNERSRHDRHNERSRHDRAQ